MCQMFPRDIYPKFSENFKWKRVQIISFNIHSSFFSTVAPLTLPEVPQVFILDAFREIPSRTFPKLPIRILEEDTLGILPRMNLLDVPP